MKKENVNSEILNDNEIDTITLGQKLADKVAAFGGSWTFIVSFMLFIVIWIIFNSVVLQNKAFDAYPFILLNLILSCVAAVQAPLIMMSQNRQEEKDRTRAINDYKVNVKNEEEIRMLHKKIDTLLNEHKNQIDNLHQQHQQMLQKILSQISQK